MNGSIQTSQGSIRLTAGKDVIVGSGFVNTTGGGSIFAQGLSGNVNAGNNNGGYGFEPGGYYVNETVGGFATLEGGDVTLEAGQDVISIPTVPTSQLGKSPGASGTYGSQPANVTVIAGSQILGNYQLANGTGLLEAGVSVESGKVAQVVNSSADIGSALQPVSLGLIAGRWEAFAAQDLAGYRREFSRQHQHYSRPNLRPSHSAARLVHLPFRLRVRRGGDALGGEFDHAWGGDIAAAGDHGRQDAGGFSAAALARGGRRGHHARQHVDTVSVERGVVEHPHA
jgi:hypothetical protein